MQCNNAWTYNKVCKKNKELLVSNKREERVKCVSQGMLPGKLLHQIGWRVVILWKGVPFILAMLIITLTELARINYEVST